MPPSQVKQVIEEELGGISLDQIFEWIDLDNPLGSASISQVHKGKLRALPRKERRRRRGTWSPLRLFWHKGNHSARENESIRLLENGSSSSNKNAAAAAAVYHPNHPGNESKTSNTVAASILRPFSTPLIDMELVWKEAPKDGIVAVKVQYPNALPTMSLDLSNLRLLAAFLSKTELKFDMLSAVDELSKQIKLEFDFRREARIMDAVARQFDGLDHKIKVPRSVPSMVTSRLLVMDFLDGIPITRMKDNPRFQNLSQATKKLAAQRILSRVSEAYGRMLLLDGLFQADGHPGNILVMKGGKIGLIDYGQSKQLPDECRASFAALVIALEKKDQVAICQALDAIGVVTERDDLPLKAQMARGMFDTSGKVDPFDPESPIKKMGISTFPADMFFVLRVVQLLRGLADGMGVKDFSSAVQWKPFAMEAQKQLTKDGILAIGSYKSDGIEGGDTRRSTIMSASLSSHVYPLCVDC